MFFILFVVENSKSLISFLIAIYLLELRKATKYFVLLNTLTTPFNTAVLQRRLAACIAEVRYVIKQYILLYFDVDNLLSYFMVISHFCFDKDRQLSYSKLISMFIIVTNLKQLLWITNMRYQGRSRWFLSPIFSSRSRIMLARNHEAVQRYDGLVLIYSS